MVKKSHKQKFKDASAKCRKKTKPFTKAFGICMKEEMGTKKKKKSKKKKRK